MASGAHGRGGMRKSMQKITKATDNPMSAAAQIFTCAPVSANRSPHQRSISPAVAPGCILPRTMSRSSLKCGNLSCPAVQWREAAFGFACVCPLGLLAGVCRQHSALHALTKTLDHKQNEKQTQRCSSKIASGLHGNRSPGAQPVLGIRLAGSKRCNSNSGGRENNFLPSCLGSKIWFRHVLVVAYHADGLGAGRLTPLLIDHSASATSYSNIARHSSQVVTLKIERHSQHECRETSEQRKPYDNAPRHCARQCLQAWPRSPLRWLPGR